MAKRKGKTIPYRGTGAKGSRKGTSSASGNASASGRPAAAAASASGHASAVSVSGRRPPAAGKAGAKGAGGTDYTLIFLVLLMLVFGLVMLYSTSAYESALAYDGDGTTYLKSQLRNTLIGLAVMAVAAFFPIDLLRNWFLIMVVAYGGSAAMVTSLYWIGVEVNGAKRWLQVGGVQFQPAELSKLAVILVTALWLSRLSGERIVKEDPETGKRSWERFRRSGKPREALQTWRGFFLALTPALLQAALIYFISNNLSSAIIVVLIAVAMMFVASPEWRRYFVLAALVIAAVVVIVYYVVEVADSGDFRFDRIRAWLDPTAYSDDTALQTLQGLYGIGSGGIFGKGLGQSIQKLGTIPEAQNDMIFAIICEELGLFGAFSIIVLYLIMAWRMILIAVNARTLHESMIVVGVMSHIMIQVLLNIAVVTNTIPNTGVTLPFFSFGGSAVVILLAEIGLVLNVARNSPPRPE